MWRKDSNTLSHIQEPPKKKTKSVWEKLTPR